MAHVPSIFLSHNHSSVLYVGKRAIDPNLDVGYLCHGGMVEAIVEHGT